MMKPENTEPTSAATPWMKVLGEVFLAETALVTGDVRMGPGVNLWPHVVIRGDIGTITLGKRVNLQDGTIVHTDYDEDMVIEDFATVGHRATLHGKRIGRGCLIGMGSILLNGTDIGEECLIAAGTLVPEGKVIPPRSVVRGLPGRIVREVTDEELAHIRRINQSYWELAQRYANGEISRVIP